MITPVCSKYVCTPKLHIPIGKAILKDDGTYILRVKKPKKDEYDEISLDILIKSVMENAESEVSADREPPKCRHPSSFIDSSF